MLISSPGGVTCGTGICCAGQVSPVWEHKVLKPCSKIRYPTTEEGYLFIKFSDCTHKKITALKKEEEGNVSDTVLI